APQAEQQHLRAAFDRVAQLVFADGDAAIAARLGLPGWAFAGPVPALAEPVAGGLAVLDTIQCAARAAGGSFDVVEVPDHGGFGAVLLAARAAGQALVGTRIVCRLHSAFSIVAQHEPFAH